MTSHNVVEAILVGFVFLVHALAAYVIYIFVRAVVSTSRLDKALTPSQRRWKYIAGLLIWTGISYLMNFALSPGTRTYFPDNDLAAFVAQAIFGGVFIALAIHAGLEIAEHRRQISEMEESIRISKNPREDVDL